MSACAMALHMGVIPAKAGTQCLIARDEIAFGMRILDRRKQRAHPLLQVVGHGVGSLAGGVHSSECARRCRAITKFGVR